MKNIVILLVTCFTILTHGNTFAQSATAQKSNYIESEIIVVNYSGFPGNPSDWIAVAQVSMPDDKSMQWIYTEGRSSGTMNFNALPKGEYEVRGYFKNEYTVRTRSRFSVGDIIENATATAITEKTPYKAGEQIVVIYSGFPGNSQDWISVAQINMPDNQSNQWIYTGGAQSGKLTFSGLPEGTYEVRGYFKNAYDVHSRYQFTVTQGGSTNTNTNTVTGIPSTLCRRELSIFYAGIGGLGSAWGRAAHEPTIIPAGSVAAMQAVIGNAKTALEVVKCVPYDVKNIDALIAKLPTLTNVQAVAEIEKVIKDIQAAVAMVKLDCGNGSTLMSLYVTWHSHGCCTGACEFENVSGGSDAGRSANSNF